MSATDTTDASAKLEDDEMYGEFYNEGAPVAEPVTSNEAEEQKEEEEGDEEESEEEEEEDDDDDGVSIVLSAADKEAASASVSTTTPAPSTASATPVKASLRPAATPSKPTQDSATTTPARPATTALTPAAPAQEVKPLPPSILSRLDQPDLTIYEKDMASLAGIEVCCYVLCVCVLFFFQFRNFNASKIFSSLVHRILNPHHTDKPWRKPGADLTDYFNYGFDEDAFRAYLNKQAQIRAAK